MLEGAWSHVKAKAHERRDHSRTVIAGVFILLFGLGVVALVVFERHEAAEWRAIHRRWEGVSLGDDRADVRDLMGAPHVGADAPGTHRERYQVRLREEAGNSTCPVVIDVWTGDVAFVDFWYVGYDADGHACWKGHGNT